MKLSFLSLAGLISFSAFAGSSYTFNQRLLGPEVSGEVATSAFEFANTPLEAFPVKVSMRYNLDEMPSVSRALSETPTFKNYYAYAQATNNGTFERGGRILGDFSFKTQDEVERFKVLLQSTTVQILVQEGLEDTLEFSDEGFNGDPALRTCEYYQNVPRWAIIVTGQEDLKVTGEYAKHVGFNGNDALALFPELKRTQWKKTVQCLEVIKQLKAGQAPQVDGGSSF